MNRDQAKEILRAYRADGSDRDDPLFREALEWAERDPELAVWLAEEQELDGSIRTRLSEALVPPDLSRQIMAGVARRRAAGRRQFLAWAAAIVLLAPLSGFWLMRFAAKPPSRLDLCRDEMAAFLRQFPRLDIETERLGEMRQWLTRQHGLSNVAIPAGLKRFPGIGCRTINWHGDKLALLCFMVDGEVVHLFVVPNTSFPDSGLTDRPRYARAGEFTTASWQEDGLIYLSLSRATRSFLRQHL